tara:strand:- start:224 stop:406 length:183 start_codon:yes stop_codon:yes gene_type:complete
MAYAKCVRPTTKSKLKIKIPDSVGIDPADIVQWVGEEFNWEWIPLTFYYTTSEQKEKNNE